MRVIKTVTEKNMITYIIPKHIVFFEEYQEDTTCTFIKLSGDDFIISDDNIEVFRKKVENVHP